MKEISKMTKDELIKERDLLEISFNKDSISLKEANRLAGIKEALNRINYVYWKM